jgi:NAD(P)-dependent dehydrogenase (short-subunit alcohol dehydrogenase family)
MKMLVTGGNRGLGLAICDRYQGQSHSRQSGYDITDSEHRRQLAVLSLDYDVFVNNAFDGPFQESWADFGQCRLLWDVASLWQKHNRSGIIINIGSVGSETVVAPDPSWETYRVAKAALKAHSQQWTRAFRENQVLFRTSLLTLDRLDTPLSRSRENWTGNGLDLEEVLTYVDIILQSRINTCIEEIRAWVNLNHKQ